MSFSYWEYKHFWGFWDFIVIGSGITGLTSAINLKKRNKNAKIAVLEKGVLPTGASTKNAGFACFGSASEILDDLTRESENAVFHLVERRYKGLSELRSLLTDKQLGYEPAGGYEIFVESQTELYEECLGSLSYINAELVNTIGKQAFWDAEDQITSTGLKGVKNMLVNKEEGLIDPGLMMKNLINLTRSMNIEIFNGVEVSGIESVGAGTKVHTNIGEANGRFTIIATNGFAKSIIPDLDVFPCRAQVLVTEPIASLKLKGAFHHHYGYNYFRNIDDRILLGGGRHLNPNREQTDQLTTTETIQDYLEKFLKDHIVEEDIKVEMRWSGIMGMSESKEVILKEIQPNILCAVRLGGMGVAIGSQLGKEVAELLSP